MSETLSAMTEPTIQARSNSQHKTQYWHNAVGIARAFELIEQLKSSRKSFLIVAKDNNDAIEWHNQLLFAVKNDSSNLDEIQLLFFPDQETLPYDHFSPHPDIISDRLSTLFKLQQLSNGICIVSATAIMQRLCPREYINRDSLDVKVGELFDVEAFKKQLIGAGYQNRETVFEHGEFAVRGSLLDVFPMGSNHPYRIELFDDEVESLRTFDVESQRSADRIDGVTILPAGEVVLDDEGIRRFRDHWHLEFDRDPNTCQIYLDTVAGITSAGIEAYLPMMHDSVESLFDYLPDDSTIVYSSSLALDIENFASHISTRFEQQAFDVHRPLLKPHKLYLPTNEFFQRLNKHSQIEITHSQSDSSQEVQSELFSAGRNLKSSTIGEVSLQQHEALPFKNLIDYSEQLAASSANPKEAIATLLCVSSHGRQEVFAERLLEQGIKARLVTGWQDFKSEIAADPVDATFSIAIGEFNVGAYLQSQNIIVISEAEILGDNFKPRTQSKSKSKAESKTLLENTINSLVELSVGAPVVHMEHGVGRYMGLESMTVPVTARESIDAEFLVLHFANEDKLYVPVTSLHLISRYMGGDEDSAPLNKLGTEHWEKARKKAAKNIHDVAAELLQLYAKRKSLPGFAFKIDEQYQTFSDQFPFEATEDQDIAIQAVIGDMQSENAMDRLVCGDVGFGKTEVAMRATFVAATNSKQTMVLVPTTLLAQQHYQSFIDRFADWPIKIDTISRFRTAGEQKSVMERFANGDIDILVGTHKLIQKDLKVSDLGLVVIDEEHRFGVRQKEQLKKLCANTDVLTMTATPIPRTLNMAMAGLRDISIITTPPAKRLSVKTFVREKQDSLVKEALLRELLRGGQVFLLHNDITSIEKTASDIEALVPEAKVAIGHGQMPERQLEQIMSDFYHKKFNILVCTTIIETGIDIPNANTILIDRADKFGLAQLHQLRGRVGRSHHQAYAYLFIPSKKSLTKDAERRLEAIENAQDLGAGFMLATHDLEIRGAGQLLGDDQSGQIHSMGYSFYMDMLDRAVEGLKNGEIVDLEEPISVKGDINLQLPALIPDDYLPDVHLRLTLYKRISGAENPEMLRELKVEMIDRFGLLPDAVNNLFEVTQIKLDCVKTGVDKVHLGEKGGYIEFSSKTTVDPMSIVKLVQSEPQTYMLKGATRLNITTELPEPQKRIEWAKEFIRSLAA